MELVPCKLNQIAPPIAISEPKIICFEIISFKKYPATIAVIIGINEVIIPACDALVNCNAFDSKIKYKQGSNKASNSINFISFFEKSYFKKPFIKYKKHKDAINILKNITVKGPKSFIADFKATNELAQINMAKISDNIPIKLKSFVNFHSLLSFKYLLI